MCYLFFPLLLLSWISLVLCTEFELNDADERIEFVLRGSNLNCIDTLFTHHPVFSRLNRKDFEISEHSVADRCSLAVYRDFRFRSLDAVTFNHEARANVLSRITSYVGLEPTLFSGYEFSLWPTTGSERQLDENTRFIDVMNYEFIRVINQREIFLCDRHIPYDSFATYNDFLTSLKAYDCNVVFLDHATGREPPLDAFPVSKVLSSKEFYAQECIRVFFFTVDDVMFLVRTMSANNRTDALQYLRELVYAEFKRLEIDVDAIDISWTSLEQSTIHVRFPACNLNLVLYNHRQLVTSLVVSPFSDVDKTRKEIDENILPWKVYSLFHDGTPLTLEEPTPQVVKQRTIAEQLNIVDRGFLTSEYVYGCLWHFVKRIQPGPVFELHGIFNVPFFVEHENQIDLHKSSQSLSNIKLDYCARYENDDMRIFPIHDANERYAIFPNVYLVKSIEGIRMQQDRFATLSIYLNEEVSFWRVVSSYLTNLSSHLELQSHFPAKELGYSLHSVDPNVLNSLVETLLKSSSICCIDSTSQFAPCFCKKYPQSVFCQNIVFLENHLISPLYPSLYVTWGYVPHSYTINDDPISALYIENGKFSLFQFKEEELESDVFLGVFVLPAPAVRIRYQYSIKMWDPARCYDVDFSGFQWFVTLLTRRIPTRIYSYVPFQKVQQAVNWIGNIVLEILQQTIGKIEYELIADFIIKPYFLSYIDYLRSVDQNASLLFGILGKLHAPFIRCSWITRISPFVGKYVEYPLIQTMLNELLNAIEDLKTLPISLLKWFLRNYISKRQNQLTIYNPITFDKRLLSLKNAQQDAPIFQDITTVKNFNWLELFKSLRAFGISHYLKQKSQLVSIQAFHRYVFSDTQPIKMDYSERLDSVLISKFVQRFKIEPSSMTLFERALTNLFKNAFRSLELGQYTVVYFERLFALYLSKFFSSRANRLFDKREAELGKEIEPVEKRLSQLKKYLNVVKEMKRVLRL